MIEKNFSVLDGIEYSSRIARLGDYADEVKRAISVLASHGVPYDRDFVLRHKDDYRSYLNAERDKYLSASSIIPDKIRNDVKSEYLHLFEATHSAVETLAALHSEQFLKFKEPDEHGAQYLDIDSSKKSIEEDCQVTIDGRKFSQLRDAIAKIRDARNELVECCQKLRVTSLYGVGLLSPEMFWQIIDQDDFNDCNIEEFVINNYGQFLRLK